MNGCLIAAWMGTMVTTSTLNDPGTLSYENPADVAGPIPTVAVAFGFEGSSSRESVGNAPVLLASLTVDVQPVNPPSSNRRPVIGRSGAEPTDPDSPLRLGSSRLTPWDDWEDRDGSWSEWDDWSPFDR